MELENHFVTTVVNIRTVQNHQGMLNLGGEQFEEEQDISMILRCLSTDCVLVVHKQKQ